MEKDVTKAVRIIQKYAQEERTGKIDKIIAPNILIIDLSRSSYEIVNLQ